MGVHGLTTFIEGLQKVEKGYREKIIIRGCPVVIDGCNLMYYLYFDGKTPVVGRGGSHPVSEQIIVDGLPKAHLYGGDWIQYAQNVRYFFQQLKHCNITAIVIFDGAYDSEKLEVARGRFKQTVQDNVKKSSSKGLPEPGKTYTPIFLKSVFLEVLAEQKIVHHQTVGEADPTIALLAKLLGRCPILSSDSDFLIYAETKPVSLKTLKFSLKNAKADLFEAETSGENGSRKSQKVWTLEGEYVSLAKICKREFNLSNPEMFPLAAVIIGNDSIVSRFFHPLRQGDTLKKRIEYVFKWLARHKTVNAAFHALANFVPADKRQLVASAMRYNLEMYQGENGEKRLWEQIKQEVDLTAYIDKKLDDKVSIKKSELSCTPGVDNMQLCLGSQGSIRCVVREPSQINSTSDLDDQASISVDDDGNVQAEVVTRSIPEWYRIKHNNCELQTYLLNIIKNQVVFFTPQVEIEKFNSTHELSIPIIVATAGILLGNNEERLIVETHSKCGRVVRHLYTPVLTLEGHGELPLLRYHKDPFATIDGSIGKGDFSKSLSHENRLSVVLAALSVYETGPVTFYEGWPASYRIWMATLLFFTSRKLYMVDECHEPLRCLSVITAIFLCVIKNLIVNPGKITETPNNRTLSAISALHKATNEDPEKLKKIREFYQKFEDYSEIGAEKSKNKLSYDITLSYTLSQYLCLVYHTEMLNNLMGCPLKSPKVRYTVNNFFIYNFARCITHQLDKRENETIFNDVVKAAIGVEEIEDVLTEFLEVCFSIQKHISGSATAAREAAEAAEAAAASAAMEDLSLN